MPGFINAIGKTLFVLLGIISEKKQEPKTWNRYAELVCIVYSDSLSSQELVFTKDSVSFSTNNEKGNKKISCAFSLKQQHQLIASLEKNKFFYLATCREKDLKGVKISLTYTKDHFRKHVCYPGSKKNNARIENILQVIQIIAMENKLSFNYSEVFRN